jgi:acyl carrier protein
MITPVPQKREEIYPCLVDLLHEMFELDKARITPSANLCTDLDIDSIDAIDLAVKFTELTGSRLVPETFKSVRTVEDMVSALPGLIAE